MSLSKKWGQRHTTGSHEPCKLCLALPAEGGSQALHWTLETSLSLHAKVRATQQYQEPNFLYRKHVK